MKPDDTQRDRKALEIFGCAVEMPSAEARAGYLQGACGEDATLKVRVEALLANHVEDNFLQQPAAGLGPGATAIVPVTEQPGDRIGHYKLREKVGEGGCGVVYVAEQEEPVRRRVALKVIKLGMDSKSVVARFEAERQALAMMDHPNIAKVLDAGTTDTGRPYFVMELVRGIRITDYCDQANLGTKERLELFIKVCQAIQHAHQKGIIHRDIKPSNILVTLHDGVPVPKIIDFGIAKATEGRLTDATVYTQLHQFIGTPAYMSPEQAEMSGLDIDTRSDIYSLGVLLYELLAGSTPFDAKELMASGLDAMRKTIREKEPVRPSTRLATLGADELTTTAKRRSADTAKLLHQLKGDLDWIVMKCLEKDRTRRYETANGLAADIKRHLNHEAIVARPPSASYRLQKAIRRNKLAFAAAAAVFAALLIGIFAASWQAVRATKAERNAKAATEQARRDRDLALRAEADATRAKADTVLELENARAALDFIRDDLLGQASPTRQPDPNLTLRTVLDRASTLLENRTALPPKVKAALHQTIGSVYFDLGEYASAIGHLERALDLQRKQLGPTDEDTLRTLHILGETYWWYGDDAKPLELARQGLDLSRRTLGETNLMTLHFLADQTAAQVYAETGAAEETERMITNALQVTSMTLGENDKLALRLKVILGHHHNWRGQFTKAEVLLSQALDQQRSILKETDPLVLTAKATLARAYEGQTNLVQAEELDLQVLESRQRVLGTNHPMTVNVEIHLAMIYTKKGEWSQVEKIHTQLLQLLADGRMVETRFVVRSLWGLVNLYSSQKQWAKVDELANAVLAAGRKQFKEESIKVVTMHDEWARSLMTQERYAEAELHCQMVVDIRTKHSDAHGRRFSAMSRLGQCLFKQGKQFDRAETLLDQGYQELQKRRLQLPDQIRLEILGSALVRLAEFYEGTGKPAQAAECNRKLAELEKAEGRPLLRMDFSPP